MGPGEERRAKTRLWREARAARLRADPTAAPHGEESTYKNWLCRCKDCRAAHTETRAAERAAAHTARTEK